MVEVVRTWFERLVLARSTRFDGAPGHCVVPLARMGLHAEEGNHDDTTERARLGDSSAAIVFIIGRPVVRCIVFFVCVISQSTVIHNNGIRIGGDMNCVNKSI